MSDFSEIENELRKLRPLPPSAQLLARVEKELADQSVEQPAEAKIIYPDRFQIKWAWLGFGLAAAAVVLFLARPDLKTPQKSISTIASSSPSAKSNVTSEPSATNIQSSEFVSAGATQVVYDKRDEGLFFREGTDEPVRRVRSRTRDTWQWQNPTTGASLAVSYPSEHVELIPVSGQ